jgi:hypothetical protein
MQFDDGFNTIFCDFVWVVWFQPLQPPLWIRPWGTRL